jgi:WD40 repeat protein
MMKRLTVALFLLVHSLMGDGAAKGEKLEEAQPDPSRSFRATIPVTAAAVSPDGQRILVASATAAELWRWGDKKPRWTVKIARDAQGQPPLFSPDGQLIAIAESDHRISVLDVAGITLHHLAGHTQIIHGICFSPDSKLLASCGMSAKFVKGPDDNTIRLWDLKKGKQIREFDREHEDTVTSVAFTPDGKQIISGGDDATIRTWDVATGKQVKKRDGSWGTWGLTFASDGKHWGTFGTTGYVNAWAYGDADKEASVIFARDIPGRASSHIKGIRFAADGASILAWGELWEIETIKVDRGEGHPTTKNIAVTLVAQRWDFTGQARMTFTHRIAFSEKRNKSTDYPHPLDITPDGRYLLTGSLNGDVQGWKLAEPTKKRDQN